jgi:hypothetical protein
MTFQDDWNEMLVFYFETEKDFIDLSRIIPLGNNPDTYSTKLYNILQSSCGQVENMMRIICDKFNLPRSDRPKFLELYKLLNQNHILEMQTIDVMKGKNAYRPFILNSTQEARNWWLSYNDTKHNLPQGLKAGNIGNTLLALCGLYALHCMAHYSRYALANFFDSKSWHTQTSTAMTVNGEIVRTALDDRPKSELFYALTYYHDSGAPIG